MAHAKTIREKIWNATPFTAATISTDTTISGGSLAFNEAGTVLRCRGYVQGFFDSTKQVGDDILLTFGLGIVSTDAFAVGASAFPDPSGEPEYPWLWWGQMSLFASIAAGNEAWGTSAQRLEVDTRAMRKVKPRESLAWICESTSASGAPLTVVHFGQTRVLFGQ